MQRIWHSAAWLLVLTGGLLGLTLPLGKIATAQGVSSLVWSFLISAGAGSILLAAVLASGRRVGLGVRKLRYYWIAGIVSYALPNLLVFLSIPRLGAGFTGIMFTLSPVVTLALSIAAGLQKPTPLGIAGLFVGFAGALIVASSRGAVGTNASMAWLAAGLAIPLLLACGNIYRSLDWPEDGGPLELAAGSHLASAAGLALAGMLVPAQFDLGLIALVPAEAVGQVAASAGMFFFFFRLQQVGGPVYLSQIGYVAAAVGLVSATLLLGERYQLSTWIGAAVIIVGVAMTTRAQRRR